MMKIVKWFVVIAIILGVLSWGGMRILEHELVRRLPNLMAHISTPALRIQADEIQPGDCQFQACIIVKNVQLKLLNQDVIRAGDVRLNISPFKLSRVGIKTDENSPLFVDATFGKKWWNIRRAVGKIGSFEFRASGLVDGKDNRGNLSVQTIGLRQFLEQFTDIPAWLSFLVQNTPQQVTLTPQKGMLCLFGIPLFPI